MDNREPHAAGSLDQLVRVALDPTWMERVLRDDGVDALDAALLRARTAWLDTWSGAAVAHACGLELGPEALEAVDALVVSHRDWLAADPTRLFQLLHNGLPAALAPLAACWRRRAEDAGRPPWARLLVRSSSPDPRVVELMKRGVDAMDCVDHRVLAGSDEGELALLDIRTGEVCWRRSRLGKVVAVALRGDQAVVVTSRTVLAVDPATGETLHRCEAKAGNFATVALGRDGQVFVADAGLTVRSPDLEVVAERPELRAASVSADGGWLAGVAKGRALRVVDVVTGRDVLTLRHREGYTDARGNLDPSGRYLVVAREYDRIEVWRLADGGLHLAIDTKLRGMKFWSTAAGRLVAHTDRGVELWELEPPRLRHRFPVPPDDTPSYVHLSPDGTWFVAVWESRWVAWSAETHETLGAGEHGQFGVFFSRSSLRPGKAELLVPRHDGDVTRRGPHSGIHAVDLVTGTSRHLVHCAANEIRHVVFHPDGHSFVFVPCGSPPELRDAETGKVIAPLGGPEVDPYDAVWDAEGERVAVAEYSGHASVWSAAGERLHRVKTGGDGVTRVELGGDHLACHSDWDGLLRLFRLGTKGAVRVARATNAGFSADGRLFCLQETERSACVWSTADLDQPALVAPAQTLTDAHVLDADGSRIVSRDSEGASVSVWTADGELARWPCDPPVLWASITPDGTRVLMGRKNPRQLEIRTVASPGACLQVDLDWTDQVASEEPTLAFDPTGTRVAIAHAHTSRLALLDLVSGQVLRRWRPHSSRVSSIRSSGWGSSWVSGGWHGRLAIGHERPIALRPRGEVRGVVIDPSGTAFATWTRLETWLWDLKTGGARWRWPVPSTSPPVFRADSHMVMTRCRYPAAPLLDELHLWDARSGAHLVGLRGSVTAPKFDTEGRLRCKTAAGWRAWEAGPTGWVEVRLKGRGKGQGAPGVATVLDASAPGTVIPGPRAVELPAGWKRVSAHGHHRIVEDGDGGWAAYELRAGGEPVVPPGPGPRRIEPGPLQGESAPWIPPWDCPQCRDQPMSESADGIQGESLRPLKLAQLGHPLGFCRTCLSVYQTTRETGFMEDDHYRSRLTPLDAAKCLEEQGQWGKPPPELFARALLRALPGRVAWLERELDTLGPPAQAEAVRTIREAVAAAENDPALAARLAEARRLLVGGIPGG